MDGKDRGHSENPGQMQGYGAGASWHQGTPVQSECRQTPACSTREGPSLKSPQGQRQWGLLAPMRTPMCWGRLGQCRERNPSQAYSPSLEASDQDSGEGAGLLSWEKTSGAFQTSDELDWRSKMDFFHGVLQGPGTLLTEAVVIV